MVTVLVLLVAITALLLAWWSAPGWAWAVAAVALLLLAQAPLAALAVALLALPLLVPAARKRLVTRRLLAMPMPAISDTERTALEAGTVWLDGEIFSGKPSWHRVSREPWPSLTPEERAFVEGPATRACEMSDAWAIQQAQDLPPELWSFLKEQRFFAMIIPKEHGGLGFSPRAQAEVISRLASHCIPLAVTVMVPNSLGPAELLVHYGTKEQQDRWLPRLADGREIPCFALTEPEAGSDAGAMTSEGVVFRGPGGALQIRLRWDKRYITLAPVATLIGLAFKLRDPERLLGGEVERGITCALVPSATPGVEAGRRHDPMGSAFLNGPTTGQDVVVPLDAVIGGAAGVGMGWRMLMECLASGRALSLPSLSVGSAQRAARVAGAHAAVRRQFGIPIARFEGIEEPLARIAGRAWLMQAAQLTTCGGLAGGAKPSVISAIAKHAQTESARRVVADAMDVVGGGGVVRGPRNLLEGYWTAQPISITVEGANILTRSLIIFGQGVIRCHPFAWQEAQAVAARDVDALDDLLWRHVRFVLRNMTRSLLLSWTRGVMTLDAPDGEAGRSWRRIAWGSARFAWLSDVALATLGGDLKRREKLTGHLADVLSALYLATCAVKRFESEGRDRADAAFLRFATDECMAQAQAGFESAARNFPVTWVRVMLRPLLPLWRLNPLGHAPSDALGHELARRLTDPASREKLVAGTFVPSVEGDALARLERAFDLSHRAQAVHDRVRQAVKRGTLDRGAGLDEAVKRGVISAEDAALVRDADAARRAAVEVDAFTPEQFASQR